MICKLKKIKLYSDENDRIWFWYYNDFKLYYDILEEVRIKILDVKYKNTNEISQNINNIPDINSEFLMTKTVLKLENVMDVVGTFNQEGLGPLKWWDNLNL